MTHRLHSKLDEILHLPKEAEWVEFKLNNEKPDEIGCNISALSNGAALQGKSTGFIVLGIENATHKVAGTTFRPHAKKIGNEDLESWLLRLLNPRLHILIHELLRDGSRLVVVEIPAASGFPSRFQGEAYIRVGSYTKRLKDFPEKEAKLWQVLRAPREDWSARVVTSATIQDLDPEAIEFARLQFRQKNPNQAEQVMGWDAITFLNKAKLCIAGKITRTALLLLGKEESSHYLSPSQARITWVLKDEKSKEKDYGHFNPPFILASDKVLAKIRNLTLRHLPSGTLFPFEVSQYDSWVMRETLHNCIAHQDYSLGGRINVVESPDALLFSNPGSFIPGTVEEMIRRDAPPEIYRNSFLSQAMVNLNMIDTIGSGIKRMFQRQRERSFPMPDYELSDPSRVSVRLSGRLLDENYTRLLLSQMELELFDVIALDRVQKKQSLDDIDFKRLKAQGLIEGRRPNIFISAKVAEATEDKARYIKNRGLDKVHYKALVNSFLEKFREARREELDAFLREKLSSTLSAEQKTNRIRNLLQEMRREGAVGCEGHGPAAIWKLTKPVKDTSNLAHSPNPRKQKAAKNGKFGLSK